MLAAIVDIMQRDNNGIWYGSVIINVYPLLMPSISPFHPLFLSFLPFITGINITGLNGRINIRAKIRVRPPSPPVEIPYYNYTYLKHNSINVFANEDKWSGGWNTSFKMLYMAWKKSRWRWGGFVVNISTTVQPTLLIYKKR